MEKEQYYRNSIALQGVEPMALWKHEGNYFVLVDDDVYKALLYLRYMEFFETVETPDELK